MDLAPTLEKLAQAQHAFLRRADSVPGVEWDTPPWEGKWSAAEVVAHLIMVERSVLGAADRILKHPPKQFSPLRKFHFPLKLVQARLIRRKSPIAIDPELVGEKEIMLAGLRGIRERTTAFIHEIEGRDIHLYYWPHPFLGLLRMPEWFEFLAAHQLRHEKQIREIVDSLRKNVDTAAT